MKIVSILSKSIILFSISMAGSPSSIFALSSTMIFLIVLLNVLPSSSDAHTLPRRRPNQWRPIYFKRPISRVTRIPQALNSPLEYIEDMFGRMGSTMRQLPSYTTKMFRNKVSSMARAGRRINNGMLKMGRSMSTMVKGWFD